MPVIQTDWHTHTHTHKHTQTKRSLTEPYTKVLANKIASGYINLYIMRRNCPIFYGAYTGYISTDKRYKGTNRYPSSKWGEGCNKGFSKFWAPRILSNTQSLA
jgi:hypothetical protein